MVTAQTNIGYGGYGAPGGGGRGGGTLTLNLTIGTLNAGETKELTVQTDTVQTITVTVSNSVTNAKMSVTETPSAPSGVNPPSNVVTYKYLSITNQNISSDDMSEVKISFKVSKGWTDVQNIKTDTIMLQKLNPDTQEWESQTTTQVNEDEDYLYFEATLFSTSQFAITGEAKETTPPDKPLPVQTIFIGIIVAALAILVILYAAGIRW